MNYSKYQLAIFDELDNSTQNILISAVAGSGKTTTLVEVMNRSKVRSGFFAFNKSIEEEISRRVVDNDNTEVSTLHSLGLRSILSHFKHKIEVKDNKVWSFAFNLNKSVWNFDQKKLISTIVVARQLVDIYRATMCKDKNDLIVAADTLGIDFNIDQLNCAIDLMVEINRYNRHPKTIDFADMIYIPATTDTMKIKSNCQLVLIDECQDLNLAQHTLLDKLVKQNKSRFVACGDRNQSIYGFTGAHSKSFDLFLEKPNTIELPLSICYRCDSSIIAKANSIYNVMEGKSDVQEGVIEQKANFDDIEEDCLVICRNVKPLLEVYFHLITKGLKCSIKGKDIGKGLVDLLNECNGLTFDEIVVSLQLKTQNKLTEYLNRGISNPSRYPPFISFQEKSMSLQIILEHTQTKTKALEMLNTVFSDGHQGGITLSTIHKAKGLEANTVYFVDRKNIPSEYAVTEDALKQEKNLLYVAMTRAKHNLYYINTKDLSLSKVISKKIEKLKQLSK